MSALELLYAERDRRRSELDADELSLLRDALTIPTCWAPWRRAEALAVLDRLDAQQTLFDLARSESGEVIPEYDSAAQSPETEESGVAVVFAQTIDGLSEGGAVLAPPSLISGKDEFHHQMVILT